MPLTPEPLNILQTWQPLDRCEFDFLSSVAPEWPASHLLLDVIDEVDQYVVLCNVWMVPVSSDYFMSEKGEGER